MIKTPLSTVIGGAFWTPGATILGSSSKNLSQLIKSLFSLGEQGFVYDPNDLTTLYQDAAGTIPVTAAGQPVGLVKDKSGRNNHAYQTVSASRPILQQTPILGSELVVNGDFSDGTTGWTVDNSWVISGGSAKTSISKPQNMMQGTSLIIAGKTYQVSYYATGVTVDGIRINVRTPNDSFQTSYINMNGYVSTKFTATVSGDFCFYCYQSGVTVDNISAKEFTGYHTDQNYLALDGVDDKLTTTLSTQLTGCTVVRSVPNVGTQILTNQTIPIPYNDNIDNCGLIVINRALTTSETAQITKLFNKAAGGTL